MSTADLPLEKRASSAAVFLALLSAIGLTSIAFGQPVILDINSTINNPTTAANDSCTISDNHALTINSNITNNDSTNCILLNSGRNNTKLINSRSNGTAWNGGTRNRSTARNGSVATGSTATSTRPSITFACPAGGTCWVGGASGAWSTPGSWSNGVPTNGTNVLIDNGNANAQGASAVTLDIGGAQAANMTVDADDRLSFNNGASLTVNGTTISNAGGISLNAGGNNTDLILAGNNTVALSGGGTVTLGNSPNNRIYSAGGGGRLVNQETIQGGGQLGVGQTAITNSGTINANVANALRVSPSGSGVTNTGTMEASGGGTLDLQGGYTNAGGLIEALAGSTVQMDGATINGGTLTTSGGGLMESVNTATFNGITLSSGSTYTLPNGTNTVLQGTITNKGNFQINAGGNNTDLIVGTASVTLQGGGTVTMGNNSTNNRIYGAAGSDVLTNQETIQGSGQLGVNQLTLVNQGLINANTSAGLVVQASGGTTNTGTMEASSGGTLDLRGGYTNTGGLLEALAGSTVQMDGATINGGTLTTSGGGLMESVNTATFNGITLSSGSTYTLPNGTNTVLQGTITNKGNFQMNAGGNNTDLHISGPVTLTGGGAVTMDNSPNNRIYALNGTDTLTNGETIQGAGQLGVGLTHLINNGTILANQPTPLLVQSNGAGMTNSGTLNVGASDLMHVSGGPFTNFAGTSLTGGTYNVTGTLQIDELGSSGGEIVTNAANIVLNTPASIFIDAAGKDVLTKLNTNATNGNFTITGGRNFTTAGSFTNNGTLTVGASTSKFDVNGSLANFSGTTLTAGTYNISGTLQFNNANIVTNAANITLTGTSSKIINQSGANGLGNFAANAATGSLTVAGGRTLSSSGAFTNNGTLTTTGTGSEFTAGGNFINNKSLTTTGGDSEVATIGSARFTNNGTLTIGSGSKFSTGGSLSNFSGTTLKGGVYNVTGTLQFTGANIVTSAASISLTGSGSKIVDQTGTTDGLRNFATNSAGGSFSISGGRNFTTTGAFTNTGTLSIGTGSTFKLGGLGNFTQTAGKTTDDGTLSTSGMVGLTGGSLFGKGSIAGGLQSGGIITPGDSSTSTGVLTVSKTYGQNASGVLDISIGGTTAGTKYDQLNIAGSASLNGTLNLSLINGFVPTVGTTFEILNAGSVSGTFSAVHGTAINGSEHFVVSCDATDCDVTVASGAAIPAKPSLGAPSTHGAVLSPRTSLSNNLRIVPALSDFHAAPSGIPGTPVFVRNDLRLAPGGDSRAPGAAWMRSTPNRPQFPAFSPRPDAGGILHLPVVREAARDAGERAMFGNSMGAQRVKSDAAGLRNRMVVGSLSWSLSKPLSKPKPGLAVY